jgi:Txe/YoeB family toxin of Txe-Axe toxin-antitoxin module
MKFKKCSKKRKKSGFSLVFWFFICCFSAKVSLSWPIFFSSMRRKEGNRWKSVEGGTKVKLKVEIVELNQNIDWNRRIEPEHRLESSNWTRTSTGIVKLNQTIDTNRQIEPEHRLELNQNIDWNRQIEKEHRLESSNWTKTMNLTFPTLFLLFPPSHPKPFKFFSL